MLSGLVVDRHAGLSKNRAYNEAGSADADGSPTTYKYLRIIVGRNMRFVQSAICPPSEYRSFQFSSTSRKLNILSSVSLIPTASTLHDWITSPPSSKKVSSSSKLKKILVDSRSIVSTKHKTTHFRKEIQDPLTAIR